MEAWEIAVPVASALVAIGTSLGSRAARHGAARHTALPLAAAPGATVSSAEHDALRAYAEQLERRVEALEARERQRDDGAAEFRGEVRAYLARISERLRITREERHGRERGSDE
jgi:hypothetical protein